MGDFGDRISMTRFRFMRVSRKTGLETGMISALKGGTITRNDDTRIKESAEFGVVRDVTFGSDLVRAYMTAEWADGTSEDVVLGTFLPVVPGRSVRSGYSTARVRLYGRLQELLDDGFSSPVTVAKGENAVDRAAAVIREAGLSVVAEKGDYKVTETRVYGIGSSQQNSEVGDKKLDMVNDLLDLAGFRAAFTDPMGRVVLQKYRDPSEIAPLWSFEEGPGAKFESSMEEERDYTEAANHVVVVYGPNEDGDTVIGEAWDRDPSSQLSTVSRGRTITRSYSYKELPPGKTDGERKAYANDRAATLLSTAQSVIWRVTMRHAYAPVRVNDTVKLAFPSGGIDDVFQVRTQTMSLTGGCPTMTEARKFRRRS